jgi:hypothetical protein
MLAADPDPIRGDLPGPPDHCVDQGLFTAGRMARARRCDELLGLDWQQRQRNGTDPVEQGRQKLGGAGDEEIAWPANRTQQGGKVGR